MNTFPPTKDPYNINKNFHPDCSTGNFSTTSVSSAIAHFMDHTTVLIRGNSEFCVVLMDFFFFLDKSF